MDLLQFALVALPMLVTAVSFVVALRVTVNNMKDQMTEEMERLHQEIGRLRDDINRWQDLVRRDHSNAMEKIYEHGQKIARLERAPLS